LEIHRTTFRVVRIKIICHYYHHIHIQMSELLLMLKFPSQAR
jgi:hypothetical protein